MNATVTIVLAGILIVSMAAAPLAEAAGAGDGPAKVERKTCTSADGVTIVYSAAGSGEPALLFIHGGLADRSFYDSELQVFAAKHRVLALDLAGHGESGRDRKVWGMAQFGADVKAVVDAEKVKHVILFGNSLGGPVAVEAALLLPGRVVGVVGIDTFQSLDYSMTSEGVRQRAEAFKNDYAGSMKAMVKMLFHPDADPAVMADAEKRMLKNPPETAYSMFMGMAGYRPADSASKLTVPLRAINGDIFPTDVAGVKKVKPDFDVLIMKHMGHYPMLERPDEFNTLVAKVVAELWGRATTTR